VTWRPRWTRFAASIEIGGLFALIAGAFLYLQYSNVSSFCGPDSVVDPCRKWQIRTDAGIGLMVVGAVGIAGGLLVAWFNTRHSEDQIEHR
jgi:hypothetical protein